MSRAKASIQFSWPIPDTTLYNTRINDNKSVENRMKKAKKKYITKIKSRSEWRANWNEENSSVLIASVKWTSDYIFCFLLVFQFQFSGLVRKKIEFRTRTKHKVINIHSNSLSYYLFSIIFRRCCRRHRLRILLYLLRVYQKSADLRFIYIW